MAMNDTLANALSLLNQYERLGKREAIIKPTSSIIERVLKILNEQHYLGDFVKVDDGRGGYLKVNLIGKINKCNVIKPRFPVKLVDFERVEKQHLPAKNFGILLISTPYGIITHTKAKELKTGGVLLAYCY